MPAAGIGEIVQQLPQIRRTIEVYWVSQVPLFELQSEAAWLAETSSGEMQVGNPPQKRVGNFSSATFGPAGWLLHFVSNNVLPLRVILRSCHLTVSYPERCQVYTVTGLVRTALSNGR